MPEARHPWKGSPPSFPALVQQFFTEYLVSQRAMSPRTVASYRDAEIVFATLWFDPALAHTLLGGAAALGSLPLHVNGRDPVVAALLADLSASVARGEDPGSLYVEQLTALAWSRLLRLRPAGLPERRVAPLPRNVLGRVREHIEQGLGRDLSVSELARVAELEPDTFARRFKAAAGLSPHAFVLEQRLQRAERLLASTSVGIAAIAVQVGFSTQSHLTETFRRSRGVTPQAYRRSFLPGSR